MSDARPGSTPPLLRLVEVSISLGGHPVVQGVTLDLERGDWLGLIGPNGAGKSTLLRAIAGLVPYRGRIELDGHDVAGHGRRGLAARLAYVPQDPLIPDDMPVEEYVLLARTPYLGRLGGEQAEDLDAAADAIDRLDLGDFARRRLGSLSGGERQRVVLARALAQRADVLLLDEPTSSLDLGHQQQLLELVDELRGERGLTVVCAMHDLTLASQYVERLVLLAGGVAVAQGSPGEVLTPQAIVEHYGAVVHVVDAEGAGVLVVPRRTQA